jgi:hypothetical protein
MEESESDSHRHIDGHTISHAICEGENEGDSFAHIFGHDGSRSICSCQGDGGGATSGHEGDEGEATSGQEWPFSHKKEDADEGEDIYQAYLGSKRRD